MRELCSRSKKLNCRYNEETGAELPHNIAYFITLRVRHSRGFEHSCNYFTRALMPAARDVNYFHIFPSFIFCAAGVLQIKTEVEFHRVVLIHESLIADALKPADFPKDVRVFPPCAEKEEYSVSCNFRVPGSLTHTCLSQDWSFCSQRVNDTIIPLAGTHDH